MIRRVNGNLLHDDAEALVNAVNTQGVMGKGIALQFKEMFPENYRLYRAACRNGEVNVGRMFVSVERIDDRDKIIVNFPTKTTWRLPSRYDYISSGLKALRAEIETRGIRSIAVPALGAGNGGLEWGRVYEMIVDALGDIDCDIRIYEPSDRGV